MTSTPLFDAIDKGLGIDVIVQTLAEGADPNERKNGQTMLSWAVRYHYKHLAKLMLAYGADPNLLDDPDPEEEGRYITPLISAARSDSDKEIVDLLLKAKADPNLTDNVGISPLMSAALRGQLENCKLLVAAGADPTKITDTGHDALSFAMTWDHPETVAYLLDLGLDPTRRLGESNSALDEAKKKNLVRVLAMLRERGFL